MSYHYFGIVFGKMKATLVLLHVSAFVFGGHAAVWLGASQGTTRWVQAGVEMSSGDRGQSIYIETNTPRRGIEFQRWAVPAQQAVRVRLQAHGAYWRVRVAGHVSRWVRIPRATKIATLEMFGTFLDTGTALINGRFVSGRG